MTSKIHRLTPVLLLAVLIAGAAACGDQRVQMKQSNTSQPAVPSAMTVLAQLKQRTIDHPDDPAAWAALGNYWFDHQQPNRAIEAYEKSLALDPDNLNVMTDLGTMYRRNNQPMDAARTYVQVLKKDPDHANARFNLGIVYHYDLKDSASAVTQWEELLTRHGQDRAGNGKAWRDVLTPLLAEARHRAEPK